MVSLNAVGADAIGGVLPDHCVKTRYGLLSKGSFSRWIINDLAKELYYEGIPYGLICPEQSNVSISTRIARMNTWNFVKSNLCITIDVHTDNEFITINGNQRNRSSIYGSLLQQELTFLENDFETMVADVIYHEEMENEMLYNIKCPSFVISIGNTSNPELLLNEKFHQEIVISLRNALAKCIKYDQDLAARN